MGVRLRADGRTTGTLCLRTRRSRARARARCIGRTSGAGVEPTAMDVAPVHGYGVGSGSGNANDGRASPVYGAGYAGYTRGARGEGCTTRIRFPTQVARPCWRMIATRRLCMSRAARTRTCTPTSQSAPLEKTSRSPPARHPSPPRTHTRPPHTHTLALPARTYAYIHTDTASASAASISRTLCYAMLSNYISYFLGTIHTSPLLFAHGTGVDT
ncbi:hypothetical protein B0H13DRAFT_727105 [Mycena leptocephala]|nr:hypothetical protein B0H13DRAFT_727105 [Mycena leptocephala]